ncbi:MAG: radical SAM protein [Thaumarchaeota archaeon]|nr:radical SAM protein [Nitrososphaerota archaeon]
MSLRDMPSCNISPRPVVMVSLDWLRDGDPPFGLGAASIVSSLRACGSNVRLVTDAVNGPKFSIDAFLDRVMVAISEAGTKVLVGISAFVWCEIEVQMLLRAIPPEIDVVLGGPQISYTIPGQLEQLYPRARYFVRGSGEFAMTSLVMRCAENGLHGLHIARMPDLCTRADYSLDSLPSPHLDGTTPIGNFVRWETRRGCLFACTFCQHKQPGTTLNNTNMATGRLLHEITAFCISGTEKIAVLDPIFNINDSRAVNLLNCMKECHIGAHLSLQCRFELTTDAFLDAVESLDVTLEFGLQTIHDDEAQAVCRPNHMTSVENVIEKLNSRHIPYEVSLIYGLPFQTVKSFQDSVDWCLEHGVPRVRAWPLMLLRGTPIYAQREKWGYVESTKDRIPLVVKSHWFSRSEHAKMTDIASSLS